MSPTNMKRIGGFFLLAAVAVVVAWQVAGGHFVTQYQVEKTVVEEDEFGDEIERSVMEDEFRFGLMPDRGYDAAAPWFGFFFVVGMGLIVVGFVRSRKEEFAQQDADKADESGVGEP